MMAADRRETRATEQQHLVSALSNPACYPHAVGRVRVLETHISWVLLTGSIAYKIKKAVNLGFLDFSTLALRKHFCEEELRLNRRLAPGIYLEVAAIRGTLQAPHFGGDGPVLEYAVRMREFPQDSLADVLLERGEFGSHEIDALAAAIASFHGAAAAAGTDGTFGLPESALRAALENFEQIVPGVKRPGDDAALQMLRRWTVRTHAALAGAFAERKRQGSIRECHGDLHLGNIAVVDGRPTVFDCIEFNPELRWIDVMSEVAFLMMDLEDHQRRDLAWRFLNRYLEETGDYGGLPVLDFYLVYRALVRAKVCMLRMQQPAHRGSVQDEQAFREYLALAERFTNPRRPALVITHGFSGCGKTTVSQMLIERLGAVRVRSDVERKRLHGLAALAASGSAAGAGIYTPAATAATYDRLAAAAQDAVASGYPTVVDAAFLMRAERNRFRDLAAQLGVPFLIADLEVPETTLRARIIARQAQGADASEAGIAVLERQLTTREPLTPAETSLAVPLDGVRHDARDLCDILTDWLLQASV